MQVLQGQTFARPSPEKVFDLLAAMNGRAIPDEQDRIRDLAQKHAREADHPGSTRGGGAYLQEESSIERDATDQRSGDHERVEPGAPASVRGYPCANGQRQQVKSGF